MFMPNILGNGIETLRLKDLMFAPVKMCFGGLKYVLNQNAAHAHMRRIAL